MEVMMKKNFCLIVAVLFCTCTFGSFAFAATGDEVLTATQASSLFSDKTFTVSDAKPDKATGKISSHTAHASSDGTVRNISGDYPQAQRAWYVKEDGMVCYTSKISSKRLKSHCGYIVSMGSGVYNMYQLRGTYHPDRLVVGAKGSEHIVTFSNFR